MTQRTTKPLDFSRLQRRKLVAEFTAGHLTSDAGLLLLREADKQIGLLDALDKAIPDPRNPLGERQMKTYPSWRIRCMEGGVSVCATNRRNSLCTNGF